VSLRSVVAMPVSMIMAVRVIVAMLVATTRWDSITRYASVSLQFLHTTNVE